MAEIALSWGSVFVVLLLIFRMLHHRWNQAAPRKNRLILLRLMSVGLALILHIVLSLLLYEPVMRLFHIDTDGFINLNGLATLAAIWCIIALLLLYAVSHAKTLLGTYYKPLCVAYAVFSTLPVLFIMLFLLAAGI